MITSIDYKKIYILPGMILFLLLQISPLLASTATLSWDAPTTNMDGNPATNLSGYKVYYGTVSGTYTQSIDVGNVTTYQVSNLTEGNTYYFVVTAYNTSNNESNYSNEASKTIQAVDTTPPVISGVYSNTITTASAAVNWTTDEASDTQVEYGTDLAYGNTTTLDTSMVTAHSQNITGLSPGTQYYYRVSSKDASGNSAVSGSYTFTTSAQPDTSPPVISNIVVTSVTDNSATIGWTTDEASTSQAEYGTTTSYGSTSTLDSAMVTVHSVNITGLNSFTPYEFRVRSKDAAGNEAVSTNSSFTSSDISPTIDSFSADSLSGTPPLTVNFSVNASDPDGYISKYEWDFTGDGNYVEDTATPYYLYEDVGTYNVKVLATDNGGVTAVSEVLTITITTLDNQPPSMESFTYTTSETDSLTLIFSVTASDADGTIVKYEWDFDGNGTYDITTTTIPVSYTYSVPSNETGTIAYTAKVRITDDKGSTAASETQVNVQSSQASTSGISDNTSDSSSSAGGCFISTGISGGHFKYQEQF